MNVVMAQDVDVETLRKLNRGYVQAVQDSNVAWFEQHLAEDFVHGSPDGSLLDRAAFLSAVARPPGLEGLQEHDVRIRVIDDVALVQAKTRFARADGRGGVGCYLDVWVRRGTRWLCVAANVNRI